MGPKQATLRKERENIKKISSQDALLKVIESSPAATESSKVKNAGHILKTARRSQKLSIKSIAVKLRIGENYLKAIEEMNLEELPEQVYSLGFVRSYAQYLDLNPQELTTQFKVEIFDISPSSVKILSLPEHIKPMSFPTKKILWISTFSLIIFICALYYFSSVRTQSIEREIQTLLELSSSS